MVVRVTLTLMVSHSITTWTDVSSPNINTLNTTTLNTTTLNTTTLNTTTLNYPSGTGGRRVPMCSRIKEEVSHWSTGDDIVKMQSICS